MTCFFNIPDDNKVSKLRNILVVPHLFVYNRTIERWRNTRHCNNY